MHKIDGPGAAPGNTFSAGDPALGVPATVVTADFMNAVQTEIINVLGAAGIAPSKPDNSQLAAAILALIRRAKPIGTKIEGYWTTPPNGTLMLNGALVSRTTYSELWAHVQAQGVVVSEVDWAAGAKGMFGEGDGSTTFRLPDLRDYFSSMRRSGRNLGDMEADSLRAHSHQIQVYEPDDSPGSLVAGDPGGDPLGQATTAETGGAETRPKNVALNWAVFY